MAISSLNPDAPSFISNYPNTDPFAAYQLGLFVNPNPCISYPFSHLHMHPTPDKTSLIYISPPYGYAYQYYCYGSCYTSSDLVTHSSVQVFHPNIPSRVLIQELDDNGNLVPEVPSTGGEMVVAKMTASVGVVKRRFRRPKVHRAMIRGPSCQESRPKPFIKVAHCDFEFSEAFDFGKEWRTSVMIKNIPNKFSKEKLISVLRVHCIEENRKVLASEGDEAILSAFDYFYLPIDFSTGSNFGFAFVNFTNPIGAWRLHKHLHHHSWISYGSNKVCEVNYARIQGLSKLIENVDEQMFPSGAPDMYLPVRYEPPYNGLDECVEYLHGKRRI